MPCQRQVVGAPHPASANDYSFASRTQRWKGRSVPSTVRERLASMLAAQDELSSSVQLRAKAPADLHLEVEGIGRVTLPVPADQALSLIHI